MAQGLINLFDFIFEPFKDLLIHAIPNIQNYNFKIGFDSIVWIDLSFVDLFALLLSCIIFYLFARFIYFLIKGFFKIIVGWLR